MIDKYKELSETLSIIMNLLKDFHESKNDYLKPDIRAYQVKISNLSKTIGDIVKDEAQKLNSLIDEYLSKPSNDKFSNLIIEAIKLNDDLWEL